MSFSSGALGRPDSAYAKRGVSPLFVSLAVAAWIVLFDNFSFWRTFLQAQPGSLTAQIVALAGLATLLTVLASGIFRMLAGAALGRWILAGLLVMSACVAHYVDAWGVLVDKNLIRNIAQTDVREVNELLSWPALLDLALRGALPAFLLLRLRVVRSGLWQDIGQSAALLLSAIALGSVLTAAMYGTLATTFRNHRELRLQLIPSNYIKASYSFLRGDEMVRSSPTPIGQDARKAGRPSPRPRVMVLMVGETARAENFSLGGYGRPTNQALEGLPVIYFSRVTSCGTDTATSLPCMFSDMGASRFDVASARARENVLDVLVRAGVRVIWLENNSGCKGVCERIPTLTMPQPNSTDLSACGESGCQDEVLVSALRTQLRDVNVDTLIVLHLMGSHGPSYFKRYPTPGPFQPTCDTNRIQICSRESLVNTYDNTIAYTSQVIAQTVLATASQSKRLDIAMLYISDHGESLGENNVYLHGLPPVLAPKQQKEIPMIGWISDSGATALGIQASCLEKIATAPYSHDNLFHSLLGFHQIDTSLYRPDLDIFAIARRSSVCTGRS